MDLTALIWLLLSLTIALLSWGVWSRQKELTHLKQVQTQHNDMLTQLFSDIHSLGAASKKGNLDVRINESRYQGDYLIMVNTLNESLDTTINVLRLVGSNLDRLSSGDFTAQITTEMVGDYRQLREATNRLGTNLNKLIDDSNMMNQAASKGELDVRIQTAKYQGDFNKITNGINDTIEATVSIIREVSHNLGRLSSGDFSAQISSQMFGDYKTLRDTSNRLGTNLNNLIDDSERMNQAASNGELNIRIQSSKYQGDFKKIVDGINGYAQMKDNQGWVQSGLNLLSSQLTLSEGLHPLLQTAVSTLSRYISAGKGAIYLYDANHETLILTSSYAFVERSALANRFKLGEGVVGQVALERQPILLRHLSRADGVIMTATTAEAPTNTYTYPLIYKDLLIGVVELATPHDLTEDHRSFLTQSLETLSAAVFSAQKVEETKLLLQQTQRQAEQLETQTRELELQNAELEQQKRELEQQKQETERQSRELEVTQQSLQQQNDELMVAQQELEQKAQELSTSNKYKAEFLANMTHELRTPLNAINLLTGLLKKNSENNLSPKQMEHLEVIYYSATDLLNLINDLLDLSRIEARQMSVSLEVLDASELAEDIKGMFEPLIQDKGLAFSLHIDNNLPKIQNDKAKLRQIIKNLMSNAVKFTTKGSISLSIVHSKTNSYPIEILVQDTGCGIPQHKLTEIFESFRQVDGSTTRKFGGTGLGLAISRQLATMLGCEIRVTSQLNEGSTFSLLLPLQVPLAELDNKLVEKISELPPSENTPSVLLTNVNNMLAPVDTEVFNLPSSSSVFNEQQAILLIDEDPIFMNQIEGQLTQLNYRVLRAKNGRDGMMMAKKYQPAGIFLAQKLPIVNGDKVLKHLKRDLQTRHIPVKIITDDETPDLGLRREGALSVTPKSMSLSQIKSLVTDLLTHAQRQIKEVVLIENDEVLQAAIQEVIASCFPEVKLSYFPQTELALDYLKKTCPDMIIIDLGLLSFEDVDLVQHINQELNCDVPIVAYTGKALTQEQLKRLRSYSDKIVLKTSDSLGQLVDEMGIFLHSTTHAFEQCQEKVESLDQAQNSLAGVEILLVDDDLRNLFALEELLSGSGMTVLTAHNGHEALRQLKDHTVQIVLTDITMPEMDGYRLIQQIRAEPTLAQLPIIALTAKFGTEERDKCIQAGADDYLTKPIDESMLLALLRVWVSQTRL